MNEKIIYQFHKNKREEVLCTLKTWDNKTFFDIRVFYRNEQNELKPTAKGLCLATDKILMLRRMITHLENFFVNITKCK